MPRDAARDGCRGRCSCGDLRSCRLMAAACSSACTNRLRVSPRPRRACSRPPEPSGLRKERRSARSARTARTSALSDDGAQALVGVSGIVNPRLEDRYGSQAGWRRCGPRTARRCPTSAPTGSRTPGSAWRSPPTAAPRSWVDSATEAPCTARLRRQVPCGCSRGRGRVGVSSPRCAVATWSGSGTASRSPPTGTPRWPQTSGARWRASSAE